MANIYVSFSPHIAKVLRHELSGKDGAIVLPANIRCEKYWMKRSPYLRSQDIKRKPSLAEMFVSALRIQGDKPFTTYNLAVPETEYNQFPDSEEKRNELVAFALPKTVNRGRETLATNERTEMEQFDGSQFRQACIYHAYDILGGFLHANRMECIKNHRPFNISEALHLFSEAFDLSLTEEETFRRQYYRRKIEYL